MKTTSEAKLTPNKKNKDTNTSLYNIAINALDGNSIDLSVFKGKNLLFVNVASECGFTNQYKDLQKLSDAYPDTLIVIGSPCNQFGNIFPSFVGDSSPAMLHKSSRFANVILG